MISQIFLISEVLRFELDGTQSEVSYIFFDKLILYFFR